MWQDRCVALPGKGIKELEDALESCRPIIEGLYKSANPVDAPALYSTIFQIDMALDRLEE